MKYLALQNFEWGNLLIKKGEILIPKQQDYETILVTKESDLEQKVLVTKKAFAFNVLLEKIRQL